MNNEGNYFFISYSQGNNATYDDLNFFQKSHFNYWIDKDGMRATDDSWKNRAKQAVFDEKCKCALFYLSVQSLLSEAVETEIDIVSERKEKDENFSTIAVLVDAKSIPELIKKAYNSIEDNSELSKKLPLLRIAKIAKLFPDEKIYRVRESNNLDECYADLTKDIEEMGLIDYTKAAKSKLIGKNGLDSNERYSFGRFYNDERSSDVFLTSCNRFEEVNGEYYIKLADNSIRTSSAIKWIVLDYFDGKMKLISEKVLEMIPGRSIDDWLNNNFYNIAFSDDEKQKIVGKVRTLSFEEYSSYSGKNNINPTNGRFWLSSINERNQQNMLMCVSGPKIDKIGLRKDIKYGIRPVIEIKI